MASRFSQASAIRRSRNQFFFPRLARRADLGVRPPRWATTECVPTAGVMPPGCRLQGWSGAQCDAVIRRGQRVRGRCGAEPEA